MEIWTFVLLFHGTSSWLNNPTFYWWNGKQSYSGNNRFIFADFFIFVWLSLVWNSTSVIKERKEKNSEALLKRRCLCTLQYLGLVMILPLFLLLPPSFVTIVTNVSGCMRLLVWAKKLLFGLLFKVQNSQSVLLSVAHHQQYYKEQEGDIEANFCSSAQSMWLLFYFMEAF